MSNSPAAEKVLDRSRHFSIVRGAGVQHAEQDGEKFRLTDGRLLGAPKGPLAGKDLSGADKHPDGHQAPRSPAAKMRKDVPLTAEENKRLKMLRDALAGKVEPLKNLDAALAAAGPRPYRNIEDIVSDAGLDLPQVAVQ